MINISSDAVRSLINYLCILGLPREHCFNTLELKESQLNQRNLINIDKYQLLYQIAQEYFPSTPIGFKYGQHIDANRWGVLGQIAYTSQNLEQALQSQRRFQSIAGSLGVPSHTLENNRVTLTWRAAQSYNIHIAEELISSWVAFARRITCQPITPFKVWFNHSCSTATDEYTAFFNCPVEFDKEDNGLIVDATILGMPCTTANSDLNKALKYYANGLVSQYSIKNPVAVAKDYIASQLPTNQPSLSALSSYLNLSQRTLQRRLMEFDTTFLQLVDIAKKEIAINYLINSQLELQQLANLLGFSEQSAFNRAVKRWTNTSPSKYRQEHQIIHF